MMDLLKLGRVVYHEDNDYVFLVHGPEVVYLAKIVAPQMADKIDLNEARSAGRGRASSLTIIRLKTESLERHAAIVTPTVDMDVPQFAQITLTPKSVCDEDRVAILQTIREPGSNVTKKLIELLVDEE